MSVTDPQTSPLQGSYSQGLHLFSVQVSGLTSESVLNSLDQKQNALKQVENLLSQQSAGTCVHLQYGK